MSEFSPQPAHVSRLERGVLAPAPATRLGLLRILVGAFACIYLLVRAHVLADFRALPSGRFEPVGLASLLTAPLPSAAALLAFCLCFVLCAAFTLGARYRVSGPLAALALLWVTSYRNSWGMVFHTDNLLVLHMIALAACPAAADALSIDAHRLARRQGALPLTDHARYGWPVRLLSALTVSAYLLAGIAKLKLSGLEWASGEVLRSAIAHDAVRKAVIGSLHSPLGAWLVQRDWPFPIIGGLTFVVELLAPLALVGARVGRAWVALTYAFHLGVLLTMAIAFPYPMSGVAFASFFSLERLTTHPRTSSACAGFDRLCARLARIPGLG